MARKRTKYPTAKPPVYTGKGRKGTGLGYHGHPGGATTPAKGMGYHGHPPAYVTEGRRHPNDAANKGPVGGHTAKTTSTSGRAPKAMPIRGVRPMSPPK